MPVTGNEYESVFELRCFKEWSNTQIIKELAKEQRKEDIELFHKFINAQGNSFDVLQGGNVQLLDEPFTEFTRLCNLLREFGRCAPDIYYFTRAQFEDVSYWSEGVKREI